MRRNTQELKGTHKPVIKQVKDLLAIVDDIEDPGDPIFEIFRLFFAQEDRHSSQWVFSALKRSFLTYNVLWF